MRKNWKIVILSLCILCLGCQARKTDSADVAQPAASVSETNIKSSPASVSGKTSNHPAEANKPLRQHVNTLCQTLCNNTEPLKCGDKASCTEGCRHMADIPVCPEKAHGFIACLAREPAAHFECNEAGIPSIKDGFCDKEQQAFVTCVGAN